MSNKASTEALEELQPLCSLSVCASPLCAELSVKPVHSDNRVNDSCGTQEADL